MVLQPEKTVDEVQDITLQIDSLLLRYLQAATEIDSQNLSAQLLSEYAEPVIEGVLRYKLGVSRNPASNNPGDQEAEDLFSEIILELLVRLRKFKADPLQMGIKDFRSLVAVIAYQACSKALRKKNPQRSGLKNRLRYVLTRWQGFALWQGKNEELLCGFAEWQNQKEAKGGARLRQLSDNPQTFKQSQLPQGEGSSDNPVDVLRAIFKWLGGPIHFNDLVQITAELWGVKDYAAERESDGVGGAHLLNQLPDKRASVATEVEKRIYLESIWSEIRQLPERQRIALLLNLTDTTGYGVIALLPATGVASFREIADVLTLSAERLAEIWNDLPMDDVRIAAHLGVTRQQVINLRKSARERLMRRIGK
jgi:RNA polymerase sigma factor (sigma-70 family)